MKQTKPFRPPADDEVAAYAYYLWEAEGRYPGRDVEYWFQAKAHLIADRLYEAGLLDGLTQTYLNSPDMSQKAMRTARRKPSPSDPALRKAPRAPAQRDSEGAVA